MQAYDAAVKAGAVVETTDSKGAVWCVENTFEAVHKTGTHVSNAIEGDAHRSHGVF